MKSAYCAFILLLSVILLTACTQQVATISPDQLQTEVARALIDTQSAYTPTPSNTNTPAVTFTPRPTNTPRPTATPKYGSLENPFPFGNEISLVQNTNKNKSNYSLQVIEVIRGDEANYILRLANMFNDDPPEGTSWMLIKLRITLDSGDAFTIRDSDFVVLSGGQIFDTIFGVCCTDTVGYPGLDATLALPGSSTEGWVIQSVFIADNNPLLALNINSYDPNLNDGLFFALSQ